MLRSELEAMDQMGLSNHERNYDVVSRAPMAGTNLWNLWEDTSSSVLLMFIEDAFLHLVLVRDGTRETCWVSV